MRLAVAIQREIVAQEWSQAQAAEVLGVNQPKVSALLKYKLDGFSVERLMNFLTALWQRRGDSDQAASRRAAAGPDSRAR